MKGTRKTDKISRIVASKDAKILEKEVLISKIVASKDAKISEKERQISEKERQISEKDKEITQIVANKDAKIFEKDKEITKIVASKDAKISEKDKEITKIVASKDAKISEKDAQIQIEKTEKHRLLQRVAEVDLLYQLSELVAATNDLNKLLDTAARSAAQVMRVKASSIRLLSENRRELIPKAVYNLSANYISKGKILLRDSELYRRALAGEAVYVADMRTDPRVLYQEFAREEGLVSMLSVSMVYQDRPIGVIRLYTQELREFTKEQFDLMRSIAHLMATAIEHARLDEERLENQRIQRQLKLASSVQRRMMPRTMPQMKDFDIYGRYVPCMDLGGDFFDFLYLGQNLGIMVGDVVGKGVAASLLMSSVRASLRAYAQDVYDLDEIIQRVNAAMFHDTEANEFATLFYGVIDPESMRLTYCNAGHEPPLVLRKGEVIRLGVGGMIVGVDAEQAYDKSVIDLEPDDWILFYTDGLTEAFNFQGEQFGRERINQVLQEIGKLNLNAETAINFLLGKLRCFSGLRTHEDDTTLVIVHVKKKDDESEDNKK